ncbi:unnamed protein product [Taenia asiatica]|uniref:t-SNARE coiled-coil homology domain-containing protein n=1 Tax=Taenia asiatica TaxID=60517 RepID=A0A0R3W2B5_TAEAS|nr:unnamed protein product [Taenia asiatica]
MTLYNRDWEHSDSHRRGVLTNDNDALAGELCVKVDLLRELSKSIGDEVREQNAFLDGSLSDMFARSEGMLLSALRRVGLIRREQGFCSCGLYCQIFLFALLFFFLCWLLLKFARRLPIGHAQFYVLYEPSSLEIQVVPQEKDVDLYVIADDDLDYFRHRIPQLEKFLNSSSPSFPLTSKMTRLVKLDPPVPWEVISPPEEVKSIHRLVNATITTYWSSIPTFTLASTSLGVERLYVPAAFGRPLFVVVFAPSSGFVQSDEGTESSSAREQQYHHYVIQLLEKTDEVVSTYEIVRAAAERQSFAYDELAAMFSTLHVESQRETRAKPSPTDTATPQNSRVQRNKVAEEEDGKESTAWKLLQHFVLGLLSLINNLI